MKFFKEFFMATKKVTVPVIQQLKAKEKIVMVTAYSARIAELVDPYVDIILVGDSLGMTLHGLDSTLQVTTEMMVLSGQAVNRGRHNAMMVVDLPFSTYEKSPEQAYDTAAHIMQQTGCEAIKLEGGEVMQETIAFLTRRNIPVMAHVGLLPQSFNHYGGYSARGKQETEQGQLIKDIKATEQAGAFSVVIEGTNYETATAMTQAVNIPTIGIGASEACDGQVLVSDDLLGITEKTAKFVKKYALLADNMHSAFAQFSSEVKDGTFPSDDYIYNKK